MNIMQFKQLQLIGQMIKGGVGSGIKGHTTEREKKGGESGSTANSAKFKNIDSLTDNKETMDRIHTHVKSNNKMAVIEWTDPKDGLGIRLYLTSAADRHAINTDWAMQGKGSDAWEEGGGERSWFSGGDSIAQIIYTSASSIGNEDGKNVKIDLRDKYVKEKKVKDSGSYYD